MARLKVHVFNEAGKTVSKFEATRTENILFVNHGAAELTINVKAPVASNPVLCIAGSPTTTFTLAAKTRKSVDVCSGFQGDSFAYSAQIQGTILEDPIVIIEKGGIFNQIAENPGVAALAFGAGALVALLVAPLFMRRRPT